jgi:hypothetical protein
MKFIDDFKLYGLFFGTAFGFIGCLLVMTSTNSVKEVPITEILVTSCWVWALIGFVGWVFFILMLGGVASGRGGIGSDGSHYNDTGSADSGGDDGGGCGGD